jgi:hypothetical protein
VRVADPARARPLPLRHDDEVDVVRHQASRKNVVALTVTLVAHRLEVKAAIDVICEDIERPYAALGDQSRPEPQSETDLRA